MKTKMSICDRLLGLILILSMLAAGISYDMTCADFLFSVGSDTASVLMKVSNELETRAYYDETSLEVIGNMTESVIIVWQTVRGNTSYSRVNYVLILSLLLIGIYLLAVYNHNSFLLTNACHNQYRQRTLEYIHHKDGKKSIL
jgi:hypothetical protein